MSSTPSAPEPGQILAGKYLVEEVLGVGGMGIVVAATHVQLDQRVAIKYLLPSALLNPEVVERFAREARAAAKIRGEHVARVIDVGQFEDGAPYMVMEHLDGHDLSKHLELYGPLPIADACRFMLETCEALAEAHAAKIVHRDLKPSNLFLAKQPDKSAIIKVLDFGISKTGDAPSAALTKTSALMGTAFYMSPEQLTNPKGVDHRSDIWTLGIILYELLAGRQPFVGESVPEIIGGILSNEPQLVRTLRPEVPAGLEAVIVKCMRSKAADRYPSVASLAAAIGPFANPKDRVSIDITARVLGESVAASEPPAAMPIVSSTLVLPPSAQPTNAGAAGAAGANAGDAPSAARAGGAAGAPPNVTMESGTAPAVAAVTTHGMSSSAITDKPKKTPFALIGGVVAVVLAIGGTAIKLAGRAPEAAPSAAGMVAAPVAPPPSDPLSAKTTPPPAVDAPAPSGPTPGAPVALAAPAMPATASPANVAGKPTAHAPPSTAVAARPPSGPATSAKPATPNAPLATGSAAPGTVTVAPGAAAASPPAAAGPASTSKNPLQMGIK